MSQSNPTPSNRCPTCGGSGYFGIGELHAGANEVCPDCHGTGIAPEAMDKVQMDISHLKHVISPAPEQTEGEARLGFDPKCDDCMAWKLVGDRKCPTHADPAPEPQLEGAKVISPNDKLALLHATISAVQPSTLRNQLRSEVKALLAAAKQSGAQTIIDDWAATLPEPAAAKLREHYAKALQGRAE